VQWDLLLKKYARKDLQRFRIQHKTYKIYLQDFYIPVLNKITPSTTVCVTLLTNHQQTRVLTCAQPT